MLSVKGLVIVGHSGGVILAFALRLTSSNRYIYYNDKACLTLHTTLLQSRLAIS